MCALATATRSRRNQADLPNPLNFSEALQACQEAGVYDSLGCKGRGAPDGCALIRLEPRPFASDDSDFR
jgi:hypothetical protein